MKKIHIIGIGGSGLSAIALVLLERGYIVSGSDQIKTPIIQQIEKAGGNIFIGHKAENVISADLVVRSSAVSDSNDEVQAAIRAGIPVLKRSEFLHQLISDKQCIAIAGTHGKTTTTAMIAWIFNQSGLDPSYIIGSSSINLGNNAHSGQGNHFIIEADEYDRMFLGLEPAISVVTSIEHDHPDCFPTQEDFYRVFVEFISLTDKSGKVLVCVDDPGCIQLLDEQQLVNLEILTYGLNDDPYFTSPPSRIIEKDYVAKNILINESGGFTFTFSGSKIKENPVINLQVPGLHNVKNAIGAMAVGILADISPDQVAKAISEFRGTLRRFEVIGEVNGVLFISDYAHHPTEIRSTLAAARLHYPGRSIWAIWQPHTYSRTSLLLDEFTSSFENADHVCVMDIYAARESEQEEGIDAQKIVERIRAVETSSLKDIHYTGQLVETSEFLFDKVKPGELVIVLSAGDADQIINPVMNFLANDKNKLSPIYHQNKLSNRALRNIALAPYTSSRIGGPADLLIQINSKEELVEVVASLWESKKQFILIGGGSNILVSDAGIRGIVLLNRAKKTKFQLTDDPPSVWAESGASLGLVARQSAQFGFSGLEWAAGIPGTIGGAVVGNAGAYGSDIAQNMKMAEILHLSIGNSRDAPRIEQWTEERFDFSYRSSLIKENPGEYIVLSVILGLKQGDKNEIQSRMVEYSNYRKHTQPSGASVGSMFKNPPGDFAGRMIEKAGLKGFRVGGAEISSVHANFFLNKGNSSANDVLNLIEHAKKNVFEDSGVTLELEIELVGDWQKTGNLENILSRAAEKE